MEFLLQLDDGTEMLVNWEMSPSEHLISLFELSHLDKVTLLETPGHAPDWGYYAELIDECRSKGYRVTAREEIAPWIVTVTVERRTKGVSHSKA